ncbi:hypothetical protein F5148DRAFT_1285006 [Russula earlei]|uniref:Uncharacterized protein n=1 Tax=Russula earlei TaxID=71964 RepID=A0ACC0U8R5_9AGAM|nr:hypothetical protein F5148DRAFT_1285006 [Russula earlei]
MFPMYQAEGPPSDVEIGNRTFGGYLDHLQPDSEPKRPSQGVSVLGDSSGALFSMYSKMAEGEDFKMVERWQRDADGILIFAGLFSIVVAVSVEVSIQDLRRTAQDTSAFYLEIIFQALADPNASHSPIPSTATKPPPSSPPRYVVWVNSL